MHGPYTYTWPAADTYARDPRLLRAAAVVV